VTLLKTVDSGEPTVPDGWNIGHLANLGVLLSCSGFSTRLDLPNLNLMFDFIEAGEAGDVRDHSGRLLQVVPQDSGVVLIPHNDPEHPFGVLIDHKTLKDLGVEVVEQNQEADPESGTPGGASSDTVQPEFDALEEAVQYKRSQKPKRYKVSSVHRAPKVDLLALLTSSPDSVIAAPAVKKSFVKLLRGAAVRRKN
jgi:hypothetical protein